MGHKMKNGVKKYCRVDGGTSWIVDVQTPAGQRRKTFRTKKEATAFRASMSVAVREGAYQDVRPIPWRDVVDGWFQDLDRRVQEDDVRPSTARAYRSVVRRHLVDASPPPMPNPRRWTRGGGGTSCPTGSPPGK